MSEMIERVARALMRAGPVHPNAKDHRELLWRSYERHASAVLAAMREPTGRMIAAYQSLPCADNGAPAEIAWREMIEAALADQ